MNSNAINDYTNVYHDISDSAILKGGINMPLIPQQYHQMIPETTTSKHPRSGLSLKTETRSGDYNYSK